YIGVALIVSTTTYFYTRRSSFYRLDKLIITTFFVSIGGLLLFSILAGFNVHWSYPLLYIFIEVSGAFMMFQFWGFANELLDSREAKRLLGFVGGGGVLGSLIAGWGVGWIVQYISIEKILLINAVYMTIASLIVFNMGKVFAGKLQRSVISSIETVKKKTAKNNVFASKYVRYIAAITAIIFVTVTFIDYQFKIVATEYFNEADLATFLGLIYAIFGGVFSFGFQVFATSRLLRLSIFLSLTVLPFFIFVFSSAFVAIPTTVLLLGYAAPLLLISMARASDYAFRYTINDAALQLLYIPMDSKLKSRAKASIDGIIKPTAIGISGLVIYFFAIYDIPLKVISILVVILVVIWIAIVIVIRKEYLGVLTDRIKRKGFAHHDLVIKEQMLDRIIVTALESGNPEEMVMALDMMKQERYFARVSNFVPLLEESIVDSRIKVRILALLREVKSRYYIFEVHRLTTVNDDAIIQEAIRTFGYMQMEKSVTYLSSFLEHPSINIRRSAIISLILYGGIQGVMKAAPALQKLIESSEVKKRQSAAIALKEIGQASLQQQVFILLNDSDPIVRREAVRAACHIGIKEIIPKLFYMLLDKSVRLDVAKGLSSFGEIVLLPARSIMDSPLDSVEMKKEVARLLGSIPTLHSAELLQIGLRTEGELRSVILESLKSIVAKTEDVHISPVFLKRHLFKEFYYYFQTLYNRQVVATRLQSPYFFSMVDTKMHDSLRRIFSILQLLYGSDLFDTVYYNVTHRQVAKEHRSNAIEIIDNIIGKDVSQILIPMLELKTEKEIMQHGFDNFKIRRRTFTEVLDQFLLDENSWVRSITIYLIAQNNILDMADRIDVFLYDSSPLVRETALAAMLSLSIKLTPDDKYSIQNDKNETVSKYAFSILGQKGV
ncbi:HEAT repeat domain-containing protein, partial [bacterium]|nr:HEAT repeat domain-containing protein [bacterium]